MVLEKRIEVFPLGGGPCFLRQFLECFQIFGAGIYTGKKECKGFQFDPYLEDLLGVLQRQLRDLCS